MKPPIAAIVGATAVGKTEVSIDVARRLGAEIVSLDSMQLYRDMDIGTAKVSRDLRDDVPHHLVDVFDASHPVTVREFQSLARAAISEIHARGNLPLLVGGSGLYFRAVVDDLRFPPHSPAVREALEAQAETLGPERLHERLRQVDPKAAGRIEPGNARRIVRALEVIDLTGGPFSDNDAWERYESVYDLAVAGLTRDREELYARIEARARQMIDEGLVEEAERVASRGIGTTARQGLGYKQVLESEGRDPELLAAEIARATKRFARRQESWFRSDPRITWFDAADPALPGRLVEHFARTRSSRR